MSRIPGLKKEPSLASVPTQLPRFGITLPHDKEEEVAEVGGCKVQKSVLFRGVPYGRKIVVSILESTCKVHVLSNEN